MRERENPTKSQHPFPFFFPGRVRRKLCRSALLHNIFPKRLILVVVVAAAVIAAVIAAVAAAAAATAAAAAAVRNR